MCQRCVDRIWNFIPFEYWSPKYGVFIDIKAWKAAKLSSKQFNITSNTDMVLIGAKN